MVPRNTDKRVKSCCKMTPHTLQMEKPPNPDSVSPHDQSLHDTENKAILSVSSITKKATVGLPTAFSTYKPRCKRGVTWWDRDGLHLRAPPQARPLCSKTAAPLVCPPSGTFIACSISSACTASSPLPQLHLGSCTGSHPLLVCSSGRPPHRWQ